MKKQQLLITNKVRPLPASTESLVKACPMCRLSQKNDTKHTKSGSKSQKGSDSPGRASELELWYRRYTTAQPAKSQSSFKKKKKKRKKKKEKSRTFPNKVMPHAICGFKLLSTPGSCDIQGSHPFTLVQGSPRRMRKSLWCVPGDYK